MAQCPTCHGKRGRMVRQYARGWKVAHNRAVRGYRGGPRPRVQDQSIEVWQDCETCKGTGEVSDGTS